MLFYLEKKVKLFVCIAIIEGIPFSKEVEKNTWFYYMCFRSSLGKVRTGEEEINAIISHEQCLDSHAILEFRVITMHSRIAASQV